MKEKIVKRDFYEILPMEEVRHFLRISGTYEDRLLKRIIESVICFAEDFLNMDIQKKQILLKGKYLGKVYLKNPLIEINSVKCGEQPVKFFFNSFLEVDAPLQKNVEILYTCGFQEEETPSDLKMAILFHAAFLYDSKGERGSLPQHVKESYFKYKKINF